MKCQHTASWYVQPAGRLKLRNPSPSGPHRESLAEVSKYRPGSTEDALAVFAVAGDRLVMDRDLPHLGRNSGSYSL